MHGRCLTFSCSNGKHEYIVPCELFTVLNLQLLSTLFVATTHQGPQCHNHASATVAFEPISLFQKLSLPLSPSPPLPLSALSPCKLKNGNSNDGNAISVERYLSAVHPHHNPDFKLPIHHSSIHSVGYADSILAPLESCFSNSCPPRCCNSPGRTSTLWF